MRSHSADQPVRLPISRIVMGDSPLSSTARTSFCSATKLPSARPRGRTSKVPAEQSSSARPFGTNPHEASTEHNTATPTTLRTGLSPRPRSRQTKWHIC